MTMYLGGAGPGSEEGRKTNCRETGSYRYHIKGLLIGSWNENLGFELVKLKMIRPCSSKALIPTGQKEVTALHKT